MSDVAETFRSYLEKGESVGSRYALDVPRNVPSGLAGSRLGQRAGSSLEFKDFRDYQPGDDLRRIDWSAYARSDQLIVRLYREEVQPHLDLVLDVSRSMDLPDSKKLEATLGLAGAFTSAATSTGYTHNAWTAGQSCDPITGGNDRPAAWTGLSFDGRSTPSEALSKGPPQWHPRGIRILISDLLWMDEPMRTLENLAYGAAAVYVVQVLAKADVNPPERGNLRLVDHETGEIKEVFVDAAAEERYRNLLAQHQENWDQAARQVGAVLTTVVAEPLVEHWDLSELVRARVLTVA
ncbi:MAG: DUF58 domain-containing protein [Planctomycetota bacterium]